MSVIVSYFKKETREQFLQSLQTKLGKRNRLKKSPAGTIVVLSSSDEKIVWGVCTLANWTNTEGPCRERHLLDEEVYSKDFAQYNKYDICISNLRILKNPVSYDDIRILVGGAADSKCNNNMWKGCQIEYASTFISDPDKSCVTRFRPLNISNRHLLTKN